MHVCAMGYFRFSDLEKDVVKFPHVHSDSGCCGLNFLKLVEKWQEHELYVSVSLNFPHTFAGCTLPVLTPSIV